ncbi:fibronectin type-III domain-containing protein [Trichonephila clavipes]|uniref:Fibronectin type-III domain-containing protein n=1 Tax=Trichonephila clavipes TaxID=2585209 RepID=A0A8X6RBC4_TRICX|nr:fibronectin type-III domain-containing protein [Trichonephila clavipes]
MLEILGIPVWLGYFWQNKFLVQIHIARTQVLPSGKEAGCPNYIVAIGEKPMKSLVCGSEDFVDKAVSTEDQDSETWERNILNNCHDCNHSSQKIMNSDAAEFYVKEALLKAEMESENYRTELEETQKVIRY